MIASRDERERLAELNLTAGKRAKASTAYSSALRYFSQGAALLVDRAWERRHELISSLELHLAECDFLTGQSAAAERRLTDLSSRAANPLELATVTCLRVDLYTTLDQSDRAVAVCLDYLRHLGIEWSPHPAVGEVEREYAQIWSQLGSRGIEDLIELPLMSDPASLATLDVLTAILPPALLTDANLLSLAICRAVNISLERGHSDASCVAYGWLGQIAGPHFGNYEAGFRFGLLAYELVETRGLRRFQARTYMVLGSHVMPWAKHLRAGRDLIHRTFEVANHIGDVCFAAYSCVNLNTNRLAAGDPLADVQRAAEEGLEFVKKIPFAFAIDVISVQLALIRTLRGSTAEFGCFDDEHFDELRFERHFGADPALAQPECFYWIRKLQARFLAGDYASARDASLRADRLLWSVLSNFEVVDYQYYRALALAASFDSASPGQAQQAVEALAPHHRQLEAWMENCPENFENRAALVGAEIARVEGRDLDAMRLYETSIDSARRNGFVHNEGIANELAARFYGARGFEQIANLYLRNARDCYLRWGAAGKVRQLEVLHAHLREQPVLPIRPATTEAPVDRLDLTAAVRASQAVSGEIVLDHAIGTLMVLALQQAGAERGLLILSRDDELRLEAEATTVASRVTVQRRDDPVTASDLPESILRYVARTRQNVILDDAGAENPFVADPYVRLRQARSILCLPLVKQAALVGVLYLENNLARGAFTPARIELLTLLATQAALSLENARLYSELQQAERNVRLMVDLVPHHIAVAAPDGKHIYGNHVMLDYYGLTPEDVQDSDTETLARHFIHPEDVEPFLATWGRGFAGAVSWETEARFRRRDGEYRWFLVRCIPLCDDEGRIVRWYITGTDIDDRKKAEEKVRQDERELRVLFDVVPQHIAVLDVDGRVLDAKRAALEFFGFCSLPELTDPENIGAQYHPDDLAKVQETARAFAAGPPPDSLEVRIRRKDGRYRWYLVRYAPLRDEQGRVSDGTLREPTSTIASGLRSAPTRRRSRCARNWTRRRCSRRSSGRRGRYKRSSPTCPA